MAQKRPTPTKTNAAAAARSGQRGGGGTSGDTTDELTRPIDPTTTMSCKQKYIDLIFARRKRVEGRINRGIVSTLQEGQCVAFRPGQFSKLRAYARVTRVRPFANFRTMLEECGVRECIPDAPDLRDALAIYHSFKDYEDNATLHGVIALDVEPLVLQDGGGKLHFPAHARRSFNVSPPTPHARGRQLADTSPQRRAEGRPAPKRQKTLPKSPPASAPLDRRSDAPTKKRSWRASKRTAEEHIACVNTGSNHYALPLTDDADDARAVEPTSPLRRTGPTLPPASADDVSEQLHAYAADARKKRSAVRRAGDERLSVRARTETRSGSATATVRARAGSGCSPDDSKERGAPGRQADPPYVDVRASSTLEVSSEITHMCGRCNERKTKACFSDSDWASRKRTSDSGPKVRFCITCATRLCGVCGKQKTEDAFSTGDWNSVKRKDAHGTKCRVCMTCLPAYLYGSLPSDAEQV